MPLKIVQLATVDMSVWILLMDQLKALQKMGHEVLAVCADGPFVEKIRAQGVEVETVGMMRELSPVADLRSVRDLTRLFKRRGADVVHSHTPKAGLCGPLAAQMAGVPAVVHTVHGFLFHDRMPAWKQGLFWMPEKWTAMTSDFLLSQSAEDVQRAQQRGICGPRKITYIGNGIDVRQFSPASASQKALARAQAGLLALGKDDFVVGTVGRLVYEKGFGELFAAAEMLEARHKNIKFLIVGPQEKDQNDAVSPQKIAALQERGVVTFTGWQNDMTRFYPLMDLFVLPSHREGIPRACMEASATELPVVASDIRGCREVVKHTVTGLLTPPRNAVALAAAIEQIMADPAAATAMGKRGREHILRNHDREQVLRRLESFYASLEENILMRPRTVPA